MEDYTIQISELEMLHDAAGTLTRAMNMTQEQLKDKVEAVATRPLSITGHHVVVHKDHPQAAELISLVNAGLDAAKASGDYQKVLDSHMTRIWEDF